MKKILFFSLLLVVLNGCITGAVPYNNYIRYTPAGDPVLYSNPTPYASPFGVSTRARGVNVIR